MEKNNLDRLDKKTRQAAEALEALRLDNRRLQEELSARDDGRPDPRLTEQLHLLREEREAVRGRVEGLVRMLEEAP